MNDVKRGPAPKIEANDPAKQPKLPVAGVGHEGEPNGGAYVPGPMGNDPRMTESKVGPPATNGEAPHAAPTKKPDEHRKARK
jgi:hypothetical protein